MKKIEKVFLSELIIIILIIIFALAFNLLGTKKVPVKGDYISKKTLDDDVNKPNVKIGCLIGTVTGDYLKDKFKNAIIKYYNKNEDVYVATDTGAVDFGVGYVDTCEKVMSEYNNLKYIEEPVHITETSFAFAKTERGKKLQNEFNTFIEEMKTSGQYDKLENKWKTLDEKNYYFEPYSHTGENGKLNICINAVWVPMEFYYNEDFAGFFVELAYKFCEKYGYMPQIESAEFSAEIAGVTSGKYDMMADIVEITPERMEVVYLSNPIFVNREILYTYEPPTDTVDVPKYKAFIDTFSKGINKNFILDGRWKMFAYGLFVTILLAICSAFFGTILGSIICFLRMSKNSYLTAIARIYIKVIQGTPIVVLLMVLNYIVFNNTGISAFVVSITGFSLDFAAYVSEIFRTGIEAVPIGQVRAAYALGFSKPQAFYKVVLPQALIHIIPVYSGQFISMVKMTSVAGYISVEDLTKVSDYVRSVTYEAFFPLISTAIIYFLLSSVLVIALKYIEKKIDPNLRSRKLKGVKV